MTTRRAPRRRLGVVATVSIWLAFACLVWLDHNGRIVAQRSAVFTFLVSAFGFIVNAAQLIFDGIELTIDAAVTWLVTAFGWIAARLGEFIVSTGSIFAKTWDALGALWSKVVQPIILQIDDWFKRFSRWLNDLVAPVLKWAQAVRNEIQLIYRTFVRPVLDALDATKHVLDILAKLHVPFAAALERYTTELESWIVENYLRVTGYVNHILDVLDSVLTLDGLLQRLVLVRSLERDAAYLVRLAWNAQLERNARPAPGLRSATKLSHVDAASVGPHLADYYRDGAGAYADEIDGQVLVWNYATGLGKPLP